MESNIETYEISCFRSDGIKNACIHPNNILQKESNLVRGSAPFVIFVISFHSFYHRKQSVHVTGIHNLLNSNFAVGLFSNSSQNAP